jgi:glycosyltransferase involved in cell wall biosynthesis
MHKISVIIPAHNEEKYLEKTLHGLREQNFLDYETIIVCNGCSDNTEEIAFKYLNQNTKIFSLNDSNVSLARNFGANEADGEILLFLDADTLLENNSLSKISQEFEGCSVATTKTKPDINKLKYKFASSFKNFYNSIGLYHGCSGVLVCKKKDFGLVKGYPELSVKEHRKLIIKLKKLKGYKVINTISTTSMRRFEEWGLRKTVSFWLKQGIKNYLSDLKGSEYSVVR